jgi:hypothetical protein
LCVFDVLWWRGQDVRSWSLVERKVLLAELLPTIGTVHRLTWLETHRTALLAQAWTLDLEGIVAKRMDAPYRAGRRDAWRKIRNYDYWRRPAPSFKRKGRVLHQHANEIRARCARAGAAVRLSMIALSSSR